MKTILRLLRNDLKRDWKRPWSMLLLGAIPLVLSLLIASVFGGKGGSGPMPTVHVAILDQDKDLLTGMLRSLPTQGDAAKNLRLHFVENREEGLRLVEKGKVSALVVLPKNMTANLLKGQTNSIELTVVVALGSGNIYLLRSQDNRTTVYVVVFCKRIFNKNKRGMDASTSFDP